MELGAPGTPAQPVAEKTVSYMRKEFRATAESRQRPPLLAEAMVDADVEIPGVIAKGKLLTLTTQEALKHKLADALARTPSTPSSRPSTSPARRCAGPRRRGPRHSCAS